MVDRRLSLLEESVSYVPVYNELVEITTAHEKAHWGEWEVMLHSDVEDWKTGRISQEDKNFITTVLRLFTQSDVSVGKDYYDNLIPVIKNNEARNMLGSFAGREGTHQRAYALLGDTLGFGEEFYLEFLEYKEMKDKVEFMLAVDNRTPALLAESIAKQVLIEGVCLFAQFAMLLNYVRYGKMLGQGDVVQWSIKDESMHVLGLSALFKILIKEHPYIVTDDFKKRIYNTARECVALEDKFITLAFEKCSPEGLTKEDMHQYVRSVTDYRMNQLGFKSEYGVENPLDWLNWITSNTMQENFFETNTAAYSKDSMVGSYMEGWDD